MSRVEIFISDSFEDRRKRLGFDGRENQTGQEVLCINDYQVVYDCGDASDQATFVQSRYLTDLVSACKRPIKLGVSYETNVPPQILQATGRLVFRPFSGECGVEDRRRKLRSVYRRFKLCMIYKSFEDFERELSSPDTEVAVQLDSFRR